MKKCEIKGKAKTCQSTGHKLAKSLNEFLQYEMVIVSNLLGSKSEQLTRITRQCLFSLECLWKFANGVTKRKSLGSNNDGRMFRVIYIYTREAYHIYDHFPQGLSLFLGQIDEDITVGVLKKFEGDGQMVVLKDGLVIVHNGQLRARVYEELICEARMVHVVYRRREDGGHHLQGREHTLTWRARCKFPAEYLVVTSSAGELRRT